MVGGVSRRTVRRTGRRAGRSAGRRAGRRTGRRAGQDFPSPAGQAGAGSQLGL